MIDFFISSFFLTLFFSYFLSYDYDFISLYIIAVVNFFLYIKIYTLGSRFLIRLNIVFVYFVYYNFYL